MWQARSCGTTSASPRWSGEPAGSNPADTAYASAQDTGVLLRDWSLQRQGADLQAQIPAGDFRLDLHFKASQPVLLQGKDGLSRKGPEEKQASYYYSVPQLQVSGSIALQGQTRTLDAGQHRLAGPRVEPRSFAPAGGGLGLDRHQPVGRQRTHCVSAARPARAACCGTVAPSAARQVRGMSSPRGEVLFRPVRSWRSPMSRASYPVEWVVRTPADFYTVKAVIDNQELDSRSSTGAIYWEEPERGVGQQRHAGGAWLPGDDGVCSSPEALKAQQHTATNRKTNATNSIAAHAIMAASRGIFGLYFWACLASTALAPT